VAPSTPCSDCELGWVGSLGVREAGGLAGAGAVGPFDGYIDFDAESWGCSAYVVRDAGFSSPIGAAVMDGINRAIVGYGGNSDIRDGFDIHVSGSVIGWVCVAH